MLTVLKIAAVTYAIPALLVTAIIVKIGIENSDWKQIATAPIAGLFWPATIFIFAHADIG